MKFILSCSTCIVRQVTQIAGILGLGEEDSQKLLRRVLENLARADYNNSTPYLMASIWDILEEMTGRRDVYSELKLELDKAVLSYAPRMEAEIAAEDTPFGRFCKALLFAVCGNLIDFAARDKLHAEDILLKAEALAGSPFAVDDRRTLFNALSNARNLLYLGDNCGEIAADKVFIKTLKALFPALSVTYAVKDQAVLNDVTMIDAEAVKMDEVAAVVSNGGKAAGTVLSETSDEFRSLFNSADAVISKGQGNFEGLCPDSFSGTQSLRQGIYFLMMAKCQAIADIFGISPMSLVCCSDERLKNL